MKSVAALALLAGALSLYAVAGHPQLKGMSSQKGNGKIRSEERNLPAIKSLEFDGASEIVIKFAKTQRVKVTTDSNLLSNFSTRVASTTLIARTKDMDSTESKLEVTVPSLEFIKLRGAAEVKVEKINQDSLRITSEGASSVNIDGKVRSVTIQIRGAGSVAGEDLKTEEANIDSRGAGSVEIAVSKVLNARVDGAGSIVYYGEPKTVRKSINGAGSITQK